jgi:succinate dehydrogenase/fumarate reductase cytochrome b subunit
MFVWVFHRISGLVMIALFGYKIYTGFGTAGALGKDVIPYWTNLHSNLAVDMVAIFLFIYHSLYGVRTCLVDLGLKKQEKPLFWGLSAAGLGLYLFVCFQWLFK